MIEFIDDDAKDTNGSSLSAFTKDGLSVWIDISLYFKLEKS